MRRARFTGSDWNKRSPNALPAKFINLSVVTELMSHAKDDAGWLQRGKQRAAIARVLRKPMTATEICAAARKYTPQIQLRDVWFLMRQFEKRNLAGCLNPQQVTGKLYILTEIGRKVAHKVFGISISNPPENIDWRKYSAG
jgi:hypothetical protein